MLRSCVGRTRQMCALEIRLRFLVLSGRRTRVSVQHELPFHKLRENLVWVDRNE
jgi:hypothetical protein